MNTGNPNRRRLWAIVGAVVVIAIAVVVVVALVSGDDDSGPTGPQKTVTEASVADLQSAAGRVGHPIYWLGPRSGETYELTLTASGLAYVRYLEDKNQIGTDDVFTAVGTYPVKNAFDIVKKMSTRDGAKVVKLNGGIAVSLPSAPKSAYVAWEGQDLQIELFDPKGDPLDKTTLADLRPVS